ncbi:VOC family protein [Salsipaludibacter albus]|uniref:VOC family protein n=1 Tax=Salsipaludibacter albus TaxID=2849650 RepID=UPI001EE4826B|nr:VOC family protein [Salsipaludibacter albus]MBY5161184.1 VOC family protein [Salsipaludibacter albus]
MAISEPATGVTASLTVSPCADAIDFYVEAFGAEEVEPRMEGPDGTIWHAEIVIEGTLIMLGDATDMAPTDTPASLGGSTCALFVYTDDVDALWERAIAAGAEEVFPLEDQFYGDRGGRVRDPFGHTWGLGQHVEDLSREEMERRMSAWTDARP